MTHNKYYKTVGQGVCVCSVKSAVSSSMRVNTHRGPKINTFTSQFNLLGIFETFDVYSTLG